jgi:hypothetical protein
MYNLPGTETAQNAPLASVIDALTPQPSMTDAPSPEVAPAEDSGTFTGESENVAGWGMDVLKGAVKAIKGEKAVVKPVVAAVEAAKVETKGVTNAAKVVTKAVPHPSASLHPAAPDKAKAVLERPAPTAPIDPARNDWRNFTLKKLSTSDDVKDMIDFVAKQNDGFITARRGVVSNDQTTREAASVSLQQLMGRKPAEAWNASQIKAGHELLLETGNRIIDLKNAYKSGLATGDEDILTFRRLLSQHVENVITYAQPEQMS